MKQPETIHIYKYYIKLINWIYDYLYDKVSLIILYTYLIISSTISRSKNIENLFGLSRTKDTNASFVLLFRSLYSLAPKPFSFDIRELTWSKHFLAEQQFSWLLSTNMYGLRILPPIFRAVYLAYYNRAHYCEEFIKKQIDKGCKQIILIGSGYDSTCLRLYKDNDCKFIEIDLPAMQNPKVTKIKDIIDEQAGLYFVNDDENILYLQKEFTQDNEDDLDFKKRLFFLPCDLEKQRIVDVIKPHFSKNVKTIAILTGVSYYITENAFKQVLKDLHNYFDEIDLFLDYMEKEPVNSLYWYAIKKLMKLIDSNFITYYKNIHSVLITIGYNVTANYDRSETIKNFKDHPYFEPLFYNYPKSLNYVIDLPCLEIKKIKS